MFETTKNFFHSNIRLLRDRRGINQETVAQQVDITRDKLAALETARTKNPSVEDLIKFSLFYKVSIDALLKVDLSKLGEYKLRELLNGSDVYMTGSNVRVLSITVDKDNRENVEYVPVKAKAGYRAGYNDPEFIAGLPKFSLPGLPKSGTFRIFPTSGDSMLPIPENSEVITQYVQDWTALKPGTPCIVILKGEQDFVFKKVTARQDGHLLLESYNNIYEPYTVPVNEVMEIWQYRKHMTGTLPDPETELVSVAKIIREIHQDIQVLKKSK